MGRRATRFKGMLKENHKPLFAVMDFTLKTPLSLAKAMELSNAHYYNSASVFGADGDFITSPEISQIFGEILGLWVLLQSQNLHTNAPHIVELGPGRGTLMADMVRVFKAQPTFSPTLHLVETSESLRNQQIEKLSSSPYPTHHHTALPKLDGPVIIIANEFFDALPMQQYVWHVNQWQAVYVDSCDDQYVYTYHPVQENFLPLSANEGDVFEYSKASLDYAQDLATCLKTDSGAALIIDYGDFTPEKRFGDTFQAIQRHTQVDPIKYLGTADLTYHVDFSKLAEIFQQHELQCHFSTQRDFLKANGFDLRLASLLKACSNEKQKINLLTRADRLVNVNQMGALFKVLEVVGD